MTHASPNPMAYHVAVALVICLSASMASADPGGSSIKIDQHVVIRVDSQQISVEYTLTMNRAGAYQEVLAIDMNRDGVMSRDERDVYFQGIGQKLAAGLELSLNGCEQSLRQVGELELSMPFTKRIQFRTEAPVPTQATRLEFHNDNYLATEGTVSISVEVTGPVEVTFNSADHERLGTAAPLPTVEQERDAVICYQRDPSSEHRELNKDNGSKETLALSSDSASKWIALDSMTAGLWLLMIVLGAFVIVSLVWFAMRGSRAMLSLAITGLILLAACPRWFHANWDQDAHQSPLISNEEAKNVFSNLHRNIYGALTAETEEELYDTLAQSVDGELLRETYLEMHRLTLSRDLVTAFKVHRIKPLESLIVHEPTKSNNRFEVRHRWRVFGIVSHAGHRHARINEYEATFLVCKNQDGWRITDMAVHDYYRTDPGLVFAANGNGSSHTEAAKADSLGSL